MIYVSLRVKEIIVILSSVGTRKVIHDMRHFFKWMTYHGAYNGQMTDVTHHISTDDVFFTHAQGWALETNTRCSTIIEGGQCVNLVNSSRHYQIMGTDIWCPARFIEAFDVIRHEKIDT